MDDDFFVSGVTDPKGSGGETAAMTTDPRPHIRRRDGALVRLRGLTTTAAVAGIAGTAVFGAVAAASWSGQPGVTSAAQLAPEPTPRDDDNGEQQTAPQATPFVGTNPNTGSSGGTTNPGSGRVRPSVGGRSHATTGGSH
jgi:hypothetical protein